MDGGNIWVDQVSGTQSALNAVSFLDASVGWIVGSGGTILHTINGGDTWAAQISPRNVALSAMHFIDSDNGWIVGDQGVVLRTTNGGQTWTPQDSRTTRALYGVFFIDSLRGFAVGDEGVVLRTADSGATWELTQPSGFVDVPVSTTPLFGVHFIDDLNGWIVGDVDLDQAGTGAGVILTTFDGGDTWVRQDTGNDNALFAVTFTGQTGYIVGSSGTLLRTLDGNNWTLQNPGPTNILFAVSFTPGSTNGYAVGDFGVVGRTTDGGATWISRDTPTFEGLYAVCSVQVDSDPEIGDHAWAAGSNGTIMHTSTGGTSWEAQSNPTEFCIGDCSGDGRVSITDLTNGIKIALNQEVLDGCGVFDGDLDGSVTVDELVAAVRNAHNDCAGLHAPLFGIKFTDAANGWAVGLDGVILHTSNGGLLWSSQDSNSPDCNGFPCSLNAVSFVDALTGVAVGDAGVILRTTNGGTTWTLQNSGSGEALFGVACADALNCWAVGGFQDPTDPTQVILHTTNGGTNWSPQFAPPIALAPLFAVSAADTQNVWAVGDSGVIIASTDGGDVWEFQDTGTSTLFNGVVFTGPQTGWLVGDGGLILHTHSGGR